MVVQFSDVPKLGNIFFTYKLENEEMHFSPEEVNAASEDKSTKSPFPFKGDNGIPQYFLPRAYQSEFYSRSVHGYQNNNHQYLDDAVLQTELQPIQNVTNHLHDTDIRDDTDLLTRSVNMSKSRRYHPIAPVHQSPKAKNEKQSSSNTSSYTSSRDYFTDADDSEHHSDTSIGDFSDDKYYKESEERGITDQDQVKILLSPRLNCVFTESTPPTPNFLLVNERNSKKLRLLLQCYGFAPIKRYHQFCPQAFDLFC